MLPRCSHNFTGAHLESRRLCGKRPNIFLQVTVVSEANIPDFEKGGGLLPAIAQDYATGRVLMLAWMNRAAWEETISSRRAVYFSRSRNKLWRKGEESGHQQQVVEVQIDCDADTILLLVKQTGAACHEGYKSCFFRSVDTAGIVNVTEQRLKAPDEIYGGKKKA